MRWLLALLVTVACATAWADPAAVDRAQATVAAAERKANDLAAKQGDAQHRKVDALAAVDRLKTDRPSWSRDRELRTALSDASALVTQLEQMARDVGAANVALAAARGNLIVAIDAELATTPVAPRVQQLTALRARVAPAQQAPRKIVIPNCDADPAAEPDELDQCAAALRDDETQLAKQATELDKQATDLAQNAELLKAHKRASELAKRDDDEPQRATPHTTGGTDNGGQASPTSAISGNDHTNTFADTRTFETDASVVLADVVDHATIDGLTRAQLSGDPSQRAAAAQKTRDAVKARLKRLSEQRAAIEARAKALRGGHK